MSKTARPNFIDGMLLTAEDLSLEQSYLNRRLTQFGRRIGPCVVEGMEVTPYSDLNDRQVLNVSPGYAIDVQGREVVLDEENKLEAKHGVLLVRRRIPLRLTAGALGKLASAKPERQVVLTVERARLRIFADAKLEEKIKLGWVPLARILPDGNKFTAVPIKNLTSIVALSWQHDGEAEPREWWIDFSAPIRKPSPQAVEVRVHTGTGPDTYPSVTGLQLDDACTRLSFKVAPMAEGMVKIRVACDFIIDRTEQAVSGAHLGGQLPSGNGVAGGVFESWFAAKGERP